MQIFEDKHQRLVQALAQENTFDGILGAALADLRVHLRERVFALDQPQQAEQVGPSVLERGIERQDSAVDLLATGALVIVRGDSKIAV